MRVHRWIVIVLGAGLLLGGGVDDESAAEQEEGPQLNCEKQGIPCSHDEVSEEARYRSFLLSASTQWGEDGRTPEEIAEELKQRPDVEEVAVEGTTIGFRVKGGGWTILPDPYGAAQPPTNSGELFGGMAPAESDVDEKQAKLPWDKRVDRMWEPASQTPGQEQEGPSVSAQKDRDVSEEPPKGSARPARKAVEKGEESSGEAGCKTASGPLSSTAAWVLALLLGRGVWSRRHE